MKRSLEITKDKVHNFVFKQKLNPDEKDLDKVKQAFESLLGRKPDTFWFARESRVEGMITVTYKLEGEVKHARFAFEDGQWKSVNNVDLAAYLTAHNFSKVFSDDSIKDKCDQLLEKINELLPQLGSNLLIPREEHSTTNKYFAGYDYTPITTDQVISQGKIFKTFANPTNELDVVNLRLKTILDTLKNATSPIAALKEMEGLTGIDILEKKTPLSKDQLSTQLKGEKPFKEGKYANELEQLKSLLEEWLTENKLDKMLICPVTHELFTKPYYVQESGQVYDYDGLFYENKCLELCPLTRMAIKEPPSEYPFYHRELVKCLNRFLNSMELYHSIKAALEEEKKITSHLDYPGTFFLLSNEDNKLEQVSDSQLLTAKTPNT
jgi:hypothetical protein